MFFFCKIRLLRYSIKYLVVFFNQTSYILNLNLHHILQLQHCLENLNSKVTNLSISLHARKQSTLIQGSPINSGAQGANWTQESSRPSLPPLKGSMHSQILIIFFCFSKQGLIPAPPHPIFKIIRRFTSRRIPPQICINLFWIKNDYMAFYPKLVVPNIAKFMPYFFWIKNAPLPLPYPIPLHWEPSTIWIQTPLGGQTFCDTSSHF